jgi:hypothetical protein
MTTWLLAPVQLGAAVFVWTLFLLYIGVVWLLLVVWWAVTGIRV